MAVKLYRFYINITRNRKQFRALKKTATKECAINNFLKILKENQKVKFEKKFVQYKPVKYHIELLSIKKYVGCVEWEKDELGRNIPAPDRDGKYIYKIENWKEPEQFRIHGLPGVFEYDDLIKLLESTKELIAMSTINNYLICSIDDKPLIVILKNVEDAIRLYETVRDEYLKNVLCFGIMSKKNRRTFYKTAERLGIPVKMFYTKSTRW